MAVTISGGIEKVSYQYEVADLSAEFPVHKVNLTVAANIPSRVDEVFGLNGSQRLIDQAIKPKASNPEILSPAKFAALCSEIDADGGRIPGDADERRVMSAAQSLLSQMRNNNSLFQGARYAQISG